MSTMILSNPPLKVCLLVVRFSPIEIMGDRYIPQIQDAYRTMGLPFFRTQTVAGISLSEGRPNPVTNELAWHFFGPSKHELVVVTKASFAFQVFSYEHYEMFKNRFLAVFDAFAETAKLTQGIMLDSIGLRYINAIEGTDWKSYLAESYSGIMMPEGLLSPSHVPLVTSSFRGATKLPGNNVGNLVVKVIQNDQGLVIPPDIASIDPLIVKDGVRETLLDIDHFVLLKPVAMDVQIINHFIDNLHEGSEQVFFHALSEKAVTTWK